MRTIARDGEMLVRRWRRGPFAYQLQLLDPALLNEYHNVDLDNGNRIRMGVEVDAFDRPLAYHLTKRDPKDPRYVANSFTADYVRVDASEVWHLYVPEAVGQYRGVPWMASTLVRQNRLGAYEDAAVAAAEEGAKKLAWIRSPDGDLSPMADGTSSGATGPDEITAGTLATSSTEIHYGHLPPGYDVTTSDPHYPSDAFGPFIKAVLRGISSGLRVSYHKLANDLEGVNYSSARAGELNERDVWRALQQYLIDEFVSRVYSEWLPSAILSGRLNLPMSKLAKFDAAIWQGRRWEWVDPAKDVAANVDAIANGLTSRGRVIRSMGGDPEEIWGELEAEAKRLQGVVAAPGSSAAKTSAPAPSDLQQIDGAQQ
jgi:lambda family phage portal protein